MGYSSLSSNRSCVQAYKSMQELVAQRCCPMSTYDLVIIGTLIGFLTLAFLLLAPVYLFLEREEEASKKWTKEQLAKRRREQSAGKEAATNGRATRSPSEEK